MNHDYSIVHAHRTKLKLADMFTLKKKTLTLENVSGLYSFATAVFTSVLVAPDVSGHDHFGTLCTGSSHGKSVQAPIRL